MKTLSHIRTKTRITPSSYLSWIRFNFLVTSLYCIVGSINAYAGQVTLGWDQSTESDIAGYKIYYGSASKNYTQSVNITSPYVTTWTISNLLDGQTYYFAATAYNTQLLESSYSAEVFCIISPATTKIHSLVREYYLSMLHREPDAAGWDFWTNEICRIQGLGIYMGEGFQGEIKFFFNSPEYLAMGKSDSAFVTDLYAAFLRRIPAQSEVDGWVLALNEGLTRNMLITSFAYSPEFTTDMINTFGPDMTRPENNLLNELYQGFLNRFPETDGYNSCLLQMHIAQCQGAQAVRDLCYQISLSFVQSIEYTARNRDSAEYVEDLYNSILRRGDDAAGFLVWVNELNNGASRAAVLQSFTDSPEFQKRVDAVIDAGCLP